MSRAIVEIFITQAKSALLVLQSNSSTPSDLQRAFADLEGAAMLVGDPLLEAKVRALPPRGAQEAALTLVTLLAEVKRTDSPVQFEASLRPLAQPPRKRRTGFDTGEHLTLVNFFREEANECLEEMTELLLESTAKKPEEPVLNELMRLTHGLKGSAGTVGLPAIATLTHEYESAVNRIHHDELPWSLDIRDQLVEAADQVRSIITDAEFLEERSEQITSLLSTLQTLQPSEVIATRADTSPLVVVESGNADSFAERRRIDRRGAETPLLRVDPTRIDRLMDSVGELVFDRTRIEKRVQELEVQMQDLQNALHFLAEQRAEWPSDFSPCDNPSADLSKQGMDHVCAALSELESKVSAVLPEIAGTMTRLKEDTSLLRKTEFALQDGLTAVRMQSVKSLFQRLTPQLRAIARQADTPVRLITSGGETEFDKMVADQLIDPLIQLLRNAVAHAFEPPEIRKQRGKSPEGEISISARHEGNMVVLEVSDDGNGIDVNDVRDRYVALGKWTPEQAAAANDERVLRLIFEPGYSGRKEVDELAGRGVGLSVVRETITRLGGEVLLSSVPGQGTTFTMRLPLTTAIANAMLFKIGGHVYAIPNVHVLAQSSISLPLTGETTDLEGNPVPLIALHDVLGFSIPSAQEKCPTVLLEYLGKRLAISCDKIVGPREIVLKSLGPMLARIPLYSGGTISPSGKVQLILDPAALVNIAYASPLENLGRSSGITKRVLVVDDSRAIREAMRRMLKRVGYDIITASDGLSAWHSLGEEHCDALVTDLEMPGENGFELLERLQSDPNFKDLPVVVISSKASAVNRKRAASLGALSFLPKPVSQTQLAQALYKALHPTMK